MRTAPCRWLVFLLALPLTAQTFVVDAQNGPGTNFTDLPPALLAVADGAILLVRPGTYGPIALDAKGMSILATAPGVNLAAAPLPIHVKNLTASQTFSLRGVRTRQGSTSTIALLQNCLGQVLLDGYEYTSTPTFEAVYSTALHLQNCTQVVLRNCTIAAFRAVDATNATVVLEQCELRGHDAFLVPHLGAYPGTGLVGTASSFDLSRCRVFGGNGFAITTVFGVTIIAPSPAIVLSQSSLRLCEDATGIYAAGQLAGAGPVPAIGGGTSTVARSPDAVLTGSNGGPAVAATVTDVVRPLPSLRTISAPPGGIVNVDVTTPIGEPVFLLFGLPWPPLVIPGFDGAGWLHPTGLLLATAAVPQPGVPLTMSVQVPNVASFVGERYGWQALAWTAADGPRFSNASIYAH